MESVKSLQHMLDQLAREDSALPRLMETGIFDEPTLEAVMIFQRDYYPPVTGIVDQGTWEAILDAYYNMLESANSLPVHVFPHTYSQFSLGDTSAAAFLIQTIFNSLSNHLSNFGYEDTSRTITGITAENFRKLRRLTTLTEGEHLDRAAWSYLVRLYEAIVLREAHSKLHL